MPQEAAHRFHDHLAAAEEFVDHDPGATVLVLDHYDVLAIAGDRLQAEDALEAEVGERRAAEIDDAGRFKGIGRHFRAFDDGVDGDDVGLITNADREESYKAGDTPYGLQRG